MAEIEMDSAMAFTIWADGDEIMLPSWYVTISH